MEHAIAQLSIARVLENVPGLKHFENELLITDHLCNYHLQDIPYFRYPMRIDGVAILVSRKGHAEGGINLRKYRVGEKQLLICKPGDIVHITSAVDSPRALLISASLLQNLQIDMKNFIPAVIHLKHNPVFELTPEQTEELTFYHDLIEKNISEKSVFRKEIIMHLLTVFLYKIGSFLEIYQREDNTEEKVQPKREEQIFTRFMELVGKHHQKERQVEFYARELFLSPKYFSSVVKRVSGQSASKWIEGYVILEAKSLLKFSEMSIQEISLYLNFPNPSFFGKYFKRQTGMSPGEYKAT